MLNPKKSNSKIFYEIKLEVKIDGIMEQSKGTGSANQLKEVIDEAIRRHLGKIRSAQIQFSIANFNSFDSKGKI